MRNLKALGLALVAALAMSAMGASGAQGSANPTLTPTEGTTTLHGIQLPDEGPGKINALTMDGSEFTCATGTSDVAAAISGPVTEVEATPTLSGCSSGGFFVTITHNECKLRIYHLTTSGSHYTSTIQITGCNAKKQIEMHVYSNSTHTSLLCTYDIPEQTINGALTITNEGAGATRDLRVEGTLENITSTRTSGAICGFGTHAHFSNAVFHANITVTGQSHAGVHRGIHVG